MKHMNILIVSLMLSIVLFGATRFANCTSPTVYLNPSYKEVSIGEEFDINIYVDYVSHLYGYEVWLTYDKNKLNASSINNGGFLNEPTHIWHQEVNNTAGYVSLAVSSQLPALGTTGGSPPSLATIHFKALAPGSSPIQFITNKTILSNDQGFEVAHTAVDGEVRVTGTGVHDVAVVAVSSMKSGCVPKPAICNGSLSEVYVTVENQGGFSETFNVTAYANTTIIATQSATLNPSTQTRITFTWNTSLFHLNEYDNYTVSATAAQVQGETDLADNTLTDGTVVITHVGDVTADGKVDINDVARVSGAFGSLRANDPADPKYGQYWHGIPCATCPHQPNVDITGDRKVDIQDLARASGNFGWYRLY